MEKMAELLHTAVEIQDRHDAVDLAQVVRDPNPYYLLLTTYC